MDVIYVDQQWGEYFMYVLEVFEQYLQIGYYLFMVVFFFDLDVCVGLCIGQCVQDFGCVQCFQCIDGDQQVIVEVGGGWQIFDDG